MAVKDPQDPRKPPWNVEQHLDADVSWETIVGDSDDYLAVFEALKDCSYFEPAHSFADRVPDRLSPTQEVARTVSRSSAGRFYDLDVEGVEGRLSIANPALQYPHRASEPSHEKPILGAKLELKALEGPDGSMRDFDDIGDTLNWSASQKAMYGVVQEWEDVGYLRFFPGRRTPLSLRVPQEGIEEEANYSAASSAIWSMGHYAKLHRDAVNELERQLLEDQQVLGYDRDTETYTLEDSEFEIREP